MFRIRPAFYSSPFLRVAQQDQINTTKNTAICALKLKKELKVFNFKLIGILEISNVMLVSKVLRALGVLKFYEQWQFWNIRAWQLCNFKSTGRVVFKFQTCDKFETSITEAVLKF